MIEEIFIVGECDRILYGDPSKYPQNPMYPVDERNGIYLTQMRVNDIRIAVLYSFIDKIPMLSYIQKLRNRLEKHLRIINTGTVLENYFLLFRLLSGKEGAIVESSEGSLIPSISSSNVYLDVVEYSNVIMKNGGIVLNRTSGSCYMKTSFDDSRVVKLIASNPTKSNNILYKSSGVVSEGLNGVEVKIKGRDTKAEVVRYWIQDGVEPLISIQKIEGGYVMSCKCRRKFDYLEACFPIPRMASKVVKSHTAGRSVYDEKANLLRWTFVNEFFKKERINYRVEVFEKCNDIRSIGIKFCVKEAPEAGMKIERAECVDNPETYFWIRYSICSGRYEIRS